MEEIIEVQGIQYKTMYVEFDTLEAYQALNEEITIGSAEQYKNTGTVRYADENPIPVNGKYYMEVSAALQRDYPERAAMMVLVDRIPDEIKETEKEI